MDARTFWLIGFALFGVIGGMLTFARRYKNPDADAGCGVAGWTVIFLFFWFLAGFSLLK